MQNKIQVVCDCDVIHGAVVGEVRKKMPCGNDFQRLSNLYKTFADGTRVKILWALSRAEMCVCDLAVLLDMTKSAISHQLKTLRLTNTVKFDKRGKEVYYSLADACVLDILDRGLEHSKNH